MNKVLRTMPVITRPWYKLCQPNPHHEISHILVSTLPMGMQKVRKFRQRAGIETQASLTMKPGPLCHPHPTISLSQTWWKYFSSLVVGDVGCGGEVYFHHCSSSLSKKDNRVLCPWSDQSQLVRSRHCAMRAAASADVSTAKCDTSFISRVKKEYLSQHIPHDLTRGGWDMSNGEGLFLQAALNFSVLTIAEGTTLSSPHSAIGSDHKGPWPPCVY